MVGFDLWLEFEHWVGPRKKEDVSFNMTVSLNDGREYALNVWLIDSVPEIVRDPDECEEALDAQYCIGPDLLVERMDRPLLERIVARLIDRGELKDEWLSNQ